MSTNPIDSELVKTDRDVVKAATWYATEGYRPVPLLAGEKYPGIKRWEKYKFNPDSAARDFPKDSNIGILCGEGLICIDLDHPVSLRLASQYLPPTGCVIGRPGRPRGHWFYRVTGDMKSLTLGAISIDPEGKRTKLNFVEVLSDGRQVVVGPSIHPTGERYEALAGVPATITAEALRAAILAFVAACRRACEDSGLNLAKPEVAPMFHPAPVGGTGTRPGDRYNTENPGDLLRRHGWTYLNCDSLQEQWRRPNKSSGLSATLKNINGAWVFFNFSASVVELEQNKGYDCLGLLARLEHGGDVGKAVRWLADQGYGETEMIPDPLPGLNLGRLVKVTPTPVPDEPFPPDCLCPPGLMGDIIRHNLRTASNPQPILALSGALALMSVITGNKVRSFANNHTYGNLFILALAPTGAGKDHARRLNRGILDQSGAGQLRGAESIGSAAGIISALDKQPVLLMQIDEIADLLVTVKNASKSPHLYQISPVLKQLKTSAGAVYMGPALKHDDNLKELVNPHLVLYGTSVPGGFWEAVTTSQVTDGLLGRFIIFEAPGYTKTEIASADGIPADILDRVRWWNDLVTHAGNLAGIRPQPILIEHTPEARTRVIGHADLINGRQIIEHGNDPQRAAVWARTAENTNQLALLCACSRMLAGALPGDKDHLPPMIEIQDVNWAVKLSNWLTRNLVQKVSGYVGETQWEIVLKKMLRAIPPEGISKYGLRRKFRALKGKELPDAITQLMDAGEITVEPIAGSRHPTTWIRRTDLADVA